MKIVVKDSTKEVVEIQYVDNGVEVEGYTKYGWDTTLDIEPHKYIWVEEEGLVLKPEFK